MIFHFDLVEKLLQQAVQPWFSHVHGPRFIRDVTHFDHNHHQLK